MKRFTTLVSLAVLIAAISTSMVAGTMGGKADGYHYAMNLYLHHTSDNAKVLFDEAATGTLNQDLAKDLIDQMGKDLDHARLYHARLHKLYTEAESQLIAEDHVVILTGHTKASEAFTFLKAEIEKAKPDLDVVKTQAAAIFDGTSKATAAHLDAMKKLGISEAKNPTL